MNKRIKELAERADIVFGFDKNGDTEVICATMDIEKFAELIVKDCAVNAFIFNSNLQSLNDKEMRTHAIRIGDYIKDRMGIEYDE